MIVTVTCDCGEKYQGAGLDYFDAAVLANKQRARCRDSDPDRHQMCRDARRAGFTIGRLPTRASTSHHLQTE